MVSSFPGVMFGPPYFRQLETDKTEALKCNKGVFVSFMTISDMARQELEWWVMYVDSTNSYNVISHGEPTIVLFTDVSSTGWGCSLNNISTGGNWTAEEANNHLHYLELVGIFLALQSFSLTIKGQHVKVMVDNMTALSDLKHMGTSSSYNRRQNELRHFAQNWAFLRFINFKGRKYSFPPPSPPCNVVPLF